ncbi:hypothetical protein L3Q82_022446, partial [Scortum barcoo]
MRISTSKSEAMVLDRKRVACPLRVGGEVLPQVEEFKYLGVSCSRVRERWSVRLTGGLVQPPQLCGRVYQDCRGEEGTNSRNEFPPCRVANGAPLVRSSVTREELGVETPLLLRIERSQLGWLGHLFRMPLDASLGRCSRHVPPEEEAPGKTQDTLERLCLSAGLGTPGVPPEELEEVSG